MVLAGKIDLTGQNAWTWEKRLELVFDDTADTFDFPGKNDVRFRAYDALGGSVLFTISKADSNSMTMAAGKLTIILDSSFTTLPEPKGT